MFLLEAFVSEGFSPNILRKGRQIKLLSIEEIQLRIVTSGSYFCGSEFELAAMFDINFNYHYFPYKFFCHKNVRYNGEVPAFEYFVSMFDTNQTLKHKTNFWNDQCNKNWCLVKELKIFNELKLTLMACSIIKFLKEAMFFQSSLQKDAANTTQIYLNPFSSPVVSLGGFIYSVFRHFFLDKFDIRIVKYEYGFPIRKTSWQEYEWASYYCFLNPQKKYRHAFNHADGAKYFRESVPDLFSEQYKEALFYNGCWAHSHMEKCDINPKANEKSVNTWGKTFKEVNDTFWTKLQNLMLNNEQEINSVTVEWECQFAKKKSTQEFLDFKQNIFVQHPLVRLTSRDCFRGAYFDVCAYKWSTHDHPDEDMFFIDINGLYSFVALENQFMIGPYSVLIGEQLSNVKIENQEFYYLNQKISGGAILVTILPPSNLKHPFLLYKTRGGKTVLTLCKVCSESNSKTCGHTDDERSFTGSYMLSEISYSLSLNYQIVTIFEIHAYFKADFIFKKFVEALSFLKITNSTDKVSNELLLELNRQHEFFKFSSKDFKKNEPKRKLYKLACNSVFGKIGQRNDYSQTLYVSSQEELENIYFSVNKISDVHCINEKVCQVSIKPNAKNLPPSRKTNCYIGTQVTSYARQKIHQDIQYLTSLTSATIYYVDCDSLVFSLPKDECNPLPISLKCGEYKHEFKNISNFLTLGPKVYFITFTENDQRKKISKIRGLNLNYPFLNQLNFDEKLFDYYLKTYVLNKKAFLKVPQPQNFANFKQFKTFSKKQEILFQNQLSPTRIILDDMRYLTKPFGFKEQ